MSMIDPFYFGRLTDRLLATMRLPIKYSGLPFPWCGVVLAAQRWPPARIRKRAARAAAWPALQARYRFSPGPISQVLEMSLSQRPVFMLWEDNKSLIVEFGHELAVDDFTCGSAR